MRKLLSILLCALALGSARAEAGSLPFGGTLSIQVVGVFPVPGFPLPPVVVTGSGTANVSTNANHIQSFTVPASAFNATHIGAMPLHGVTKVCLFKVCSNATANISIPFSALVGVGGTIVVDNTVTTSRATTVIGAPWTAGVAAVGTVTQMGLAHGPGSGTSSTGQASGAVRLVSPIFVSTSIGVYATAPSFALLDLHFAPEPSALWLSGGGAVALVLLGIARRR